MNDLISRKALCEYALNQKDKSITPNDIMRFPSAQTEVIWCNECKYYEGVHNIQGHAPCSYWEAGGVLWNWFCSQAERREDE